jgi:predicted nucleic acid-binding protein
MSFLLDTVTLSELRKKSRTHPAVFAWQKKQTGNAFISVVTMNEIQYGIRTVESRDVNFAEHLKSWYQEILAARDFFTLLPVDLRVAEQSADLRYHHKMSYNDSLIAATAICHDLTLATRNVDDFLGTNVKLVNPWEE